MIKALLWTLVFYFVIRFIFNFIIPVAKATRQMKRQMRNFQENMGGQFNGTPQQGTAFNAPPDQPNRPAERSKQGDYIDFEEIK